MTEIGCEQSIFTAGRRCYRQFFQSIKVDAMIGDIIWGSDFNLCDTVGIVTQHVYAGASSNNKS